MMKNVKRQMTLLIMALFCCVCLSGCDGGMFSSSSSGSASIKEMSMGSDTNTQYYDNDGYANTSIAGVQSDYSYYVNAEGNTKKRKTEMLEDFEKIQDFVTEHGGFVENVNNRYDSETRYDNQYKEKGYLDFMIQLPNEEMEGMIDFLDEIIQANKFKVTYYCQQIYNYEGWSVLPDEEEEYSGYNHRITQEELAKRLKYADLSVSIEYRHPRAFISVVWRELCDIWESFWSGIGTILIGFMLCAVGFIILFMESIVFYKLYRWMMYRHRTKHPDYYPPKEVMIKNDFNSVSLEKPHEKPDIKAEKKQ